MDDAEAGTSKLEHAYLQGECSNSAQLCRRKLRCCLGKHIPRFATTMNCDYQVVTHSSLIKCLLFTMHCDECWENKLEHINRDPYL